jgi:SdpC family antimicrobial peptide
MNWKKTVGFLVIVALLLTVSALSFHTNSASAEKVKKYSGEQIFRGFVFGQGEVAKKIPEIFDQKTIKKLNSPEAIKGVNEMLQVIKKEDPSYFQDLQNAVYSKNPQKVEDLLKKGGAIIKSSMNITDVKSRQVVQPAAGWETENWVYKYTAIGGVVFAVVTVVLTQIDATPVLAKPGLDGETAVTTLVESLN